MTKTKRDLISFYTILSKEVARINRIWTQTILPSMTSTALYFIVFGSLIGSRIGEMGGFDYIAFIIPGLIMMSVITNSYSNVVSTFFSAKMFKSIQEILVSPTPNRIVIAGYVAGGMYRGLIVGFFVSAISLFFHPLEIVNLFVVISSILLTSILFSLAGLVNGIYAKDFDQVSIVPTFVLTPLTYLGGIFYSIKLLPEFFQTLSLANPILYMVNLFRYGFLGVSDVNIYTAYIVVIIPIIAFYMWADYLLNKGHGMRE